MEPLVVREPTRSCWWGWLGLGMLGLVAIARRIPAPPIALPVRRVRLERPLEDVLAQQREDLSARALVRDADAVVARGSREGGASSGMRRLNSSVFPTAR